MARRVRKGRIILVTIMVLLSIVALLIMWPYMRAILAALVVSYIFLPLQQVLVKRTKHPSLSASITLLIIALFVIVPLVLSGFLLVQEAQLLVTDSSIGINQAIESISSIELPEAVTSIIDQERIEQYLTGTIESLSSDVSNDLNTILYNAANVFLQLFVFLFLTFFFLRDYVRIQNVVSHAGRSLLTLSDAKLLETYFGRVGNTVNAVVRGTIIISIVQSLLLVPAYYLVGISTPLIWGILTFFVGLVPIIGVPGVWLPILLFKLFEALAFSDQGLLVRVVIYALWAMIVVSQIDNVIRPAIIGRQAKIHPVVIFLGIIGGLPLFGIVGVIVGPVVLTAVIMFFNMFFIERPEEAS